MYIIEISHRFYKVIRFVVVEDHFLIGKGKMFIILHPRFIYKKILLIQ